MISMKKDLLRALGWGFMEWLLYFPVLYIPVVYLLPESLQMIWSLTVFLGYGIGFAGSRLFRLNTFLKTFIWALIVAVGVSYAFFGLTLALLISIPSLYVTCYRGTRMEHNGLTYMYTGSYFMVGFIIYGVSSFVLSFNEHFQQHMLVLTIAGAAALIFTLFIVNRNYVEEQTLPGSGRPMVEQRVRRQNKGMITIVILIIGVLVLLPQLQQWIAHLGKSIASWINGLISYSPEELEMVEPERPEEVEFPFSKEVSSPSAFSEFLDKLVFFIVYIALAVLILYLIYRFVKFAPKLIKQLSAWINRLMSRETQDEAFLGYEDEEIEIEHEKTAGRLKRLLSRYRKNGTLQSGSELEDNAMKIRHVYRRILNRKIREGYLWKDFKTPRETKRDLMEWKEADESISEEFIKLYEQARYGHHAIQDEEINNHIKEFKR